MCLVLPKLDKEMDLTRPAPPVQGCVFPWCYGFRTDPADLDGLSSPLGLYSAEVAKDDGDPMDWEPTGRLLRPSRGESRHAVPVREPDRIRPADRPLAWRAY